MSAGGRPPGPTDYRSDDEPLLAVAVCDGQRCHALRALQDSRTPGSPDSDQVIREAVRGTKRSLMLTTGCLGACAEGAVVAVGWATLRDRSLAWLWPPACWASTETPQRATAVARWISALAPSLTGSPTGPAVLRRRR